jgi:putative flippase GtrA
MPTSSRSLTRQVLAFALVGGIGLVIDLAVFNLLRATLLSPAHVHSGPVIAKVISTSLAIVANWLGNRFLTFRSETPRNAAKEGVEFVVVSVAGMGIAVGCLVVSHYLLGFRSVLADNLATNVVGLGLGSAFRFAMYRWWVFADPSTRLTYSNIRSKLEQWTRMRHAQDGATS